MKLSEFPKGTFMFFPNSDLEKEFYSRGALAAETDDIEEKEFVEQSLSIIHPILVKGFFEGWVAKKRLIEEYKEYETRQDVFNLLERELKRNLTENEKTVVAIMRYDGIDPLRIAEYLRVIEKGD